MSRTSNSWRNSAPQSWHMEHSTRHFLSGQKMDTGCCALGRYQCLSLSVETSGCSIVKVRSACRCQHICLAQLERGSNVVLTRTFHTPPQKHRREISFFVFKLFHIFLLFLFAMIIKCSVLCFCRWLTQNYCIRCLPKSCAFNIYASGCQCANDSLIE